MFSTYAVLALLAAPAIMGSPVPENKAMIIRGTPSASQFGLCNGGFQEPCKKGTTPPPNKYGCKWYDGGDGYWHECPNWSGGGWDSSSKECTAPSGYSCYNNNGWADSNSSPCDPCWECCEGKGSTPILEALDVFFDLNIDVNILDVLI